MLSPVPADSAAPQRGPPDDLGRPGDPGQRDRRGRAPARRSRAARRPRRGRSTRSPTRRRGRWPARRPGCAAPGPPPASRQVSQSCGSSTWLTRAACSGSCSASQRSLVTVNDIVGTDPVRAAHSAGPPNSATSAAACGADFTSFHSIAGRTTSPGVVERDHAVLLGRDPDRVRPLEQVPARPPSAPPTSGPAWHSVPSGCGALAAADDRPVVGPAQEHLGGLRGGIDPGDQLHAGKVTSSGPAVTKPPFGMKSERVSGRNGARAPPGRPRRSRLGGRPGIGAVTWHHGCMAWR